MKTCAVMTLAVVVLLMTAATSPADVVKGCTGHWYVDEQTGFSLPFRLYTPTAHLRYTPSKDYFGTNSFNYQAFGGALYSPITSITIEVAPVNDAPVAMADFYCIDGNRLVVGALDGVLANDDEVETPDALLAVLDSGASHGTLALDDAGSFTYEPEKAFSDRTRSAIWPSTARTTVHASMGTAPDYSQVWRNTGPHFSPTRRVGHANRDDGGLRSRRLGSQHHRLRFTV